MLKKPGWKIGQRMSKAFKQPKITIPLGSIVNITMDHIQEYNRNRIINNSAYIFDEPQLPSDYENINFLLVDYCNFISFDPGDNDNHWIYHYYQLLHDETLYEVSYKIVGNLFHPDNFLTVVKRGVAK